MSKAGQKRLDPLCNKIFPEEDLKHKYRVKKIIGKGQYGYVAKAIRRADNQFVAIKKLVNIFSNQFEAKRILREIVLLKRCVHPNIVALIEILIPKGKTLENFDQIYLVTEYCDTDLRKLFKLQETFLELEDVKYILYQIICGIKYLHSASIVHRDLTPSNILINGEGMKIKICDLGLARVIEQKQNEHPDLEAEHSSSEDETEVSQINPLIQSEKAMRQKQLINTYEFIETESLPGTPISVNQTKDQFFQQNSEFTQLSQSGGSILKQTQEDEDNNLNNSQKSLPETKAVKKKKGLKRMNSKRVELQDFGAKQKSDEKLGSSQEEKKQRKLQKKTSMCNPLAKLTLRVTTRWYRAPEIILLQRGYSKPIDVWSLGCLFGELIKMIKSVCHNSLQRFPLFPGKYCYPVSPATLNNINRQQSKAEESPSSKKHDQLFMIISTIGKPTEEEMDFLTDEGAKQYIRSMENFQRKSLTKFFPSMPKQAIEILQSTLIFDPRQRVSIDEILKFPFFEGLRSQEMEKQTKPIIMEFEEQEDLNLERIRKYMAQEISALLD